MNNGSACMSKMYEECVSWGGGGSVLEMERVYVCVWGECLRDRDSENACVCV